MRLKNRNGVKPPGRVSRSGARYVLEAENDSRQQFVDGLRAGYREARRSYINPFKVFGAVRQVHGWPHAVRWLARAVFKLVQARIHRARFEGDSRGN